MNDMTKKMLALSTIDDPVETSQLFLDMEASLPISARYTEQGVKGLQQESVNSDTTLEITKDRVFTIEKILYSGDMGGILCAIFHVEGKQQNIISITHLKIDSDHPLATRIQQYQKRRKLALAIANSGTNFSNTKLKRKKRGFGS
jgi:hypothetical protein